MDRKVTIPADILHMRPPFYPHYLLAIVSNGAPYAHSSRIQAV